MHKTMHKLARIIAAVFAFAICAPSLAATYYKIGDDELGKSSFTTNVSGSVGWATSAGATATTPFSVTQMAESDFVVSSLTLRTPPTDTDVAFGGRSLTLAGGTLWLKKNSDGGNRNITFSALSIEGLGTITMGQYQSQFTLKGTFSLAADSTFRTSFGTAPDSGDYRPLVIDSTLTGDATTAIDITGSGNAANTSGLTLNAVGGFYGTITSTADSPTFTLAINGAFGGTITSLPASTTAVKIDYDGLPAATGLRVASTTISAALKTKLTLYSATTDFTQDRLPLVTFPAGTDVDPTEFTVKHATSATGTATAFPHLTVVTNADDTVTLAVDATVPMYAKMVKGEGDVYAWHFYGCGWDDVTATCGLSVPDSTIKVYVTSTEEVASILANPGTPAGYRIGNLSADADLTSLSPLVIETGSEIDLNGHALTVSGSVVDALKASTRDLVVNGNFEAKSLSNGAYDTSAISGWSKSGTVALIKNNNSYAYKQSSSGSSQNTTVMCYIAKNGYITQTITVPEQVLCTLSLNKANKNWYNSGNKYSGSAGSVYVDGSSKITMDTSDGGNQRSFSATFELAAGAHTLKIAWTSGGDGFSVDNVKLTCTPSTATITSSAAGGELHVNVPSGSTVTDSAVSITGHVKFVKEGAGTFVSTVAQTYTDGTLVAAGTAQEPANPANYAGQGVFPVYGSGTITVESNATFTVQSAHVFKNDIVLAGGRLSGTLNNVVAHLTRVTADSQIFLNGNEVFMHIGASGSHLYLDGHALAFSGGTGVQYFCIDSSLAGETGRFVFDSSAEYVGKLPVDGNGVDVEINAMAHMSTPAAVHDYKISGEQTQWGRGTAHGLDVYGTFTPVSATFYGCTMMDGSTIDLSEKTGAWSIQSSIPDAVSNYGLTEDQQTARKTVSFADNATIYIKLGDRRGFSRRTPVISWTTRPSNLDGLTFKRAEGNVKMVKRADGVYIQPGLIVIVK